MASRLLAGCLEEGCDYTGTVLTGWLPYRVAQRLLSHAPELLQDPRRRRARGDAISVRVRVRHLRCPKCGAEGTLTRAATAAEVGRVLRGYERTAARRF